eukprot:7293297-Pyramimonas_sp.AAC.1
MRSEVNSIIGTGHDNMRQTVVELLRPQVTRLDGHDIDIPNLREHADSLAHGQRALREDLDAVQRSLAQAQAAYDNASDLSRLSAHDRAPARLPHRLCPSRGFGG